MNRLAQTFVAGCLRSPFLIAGLLSLTCVLLAPLPARANGPEIGFDGGGIVPLASSDIQLAREVVDLYAPLLDGYTPGRASCLYVLVNHSDQSRTLSMSFVGGDGRWFDDFAVPLATTAFEVSIHGRRAPVRLEKADRKRWIRFQVAVPESLPVWDVAIPAHDSTLVSIEYGITWSGGSDGTSESRDLHYFARPASLWAGPIREATFRLHLGSLATTLLRGRPFDSFRREEGPVRLSVEPADATWTSDGLLWRRSNWEPDHDFRFLITWDIEETTGD